MFRIFGVLCGNLPHIIVKYPEFWCRFPLNLLVHYSDNPHKLEYIVDDGEIFGNISGDFEVSLSGSYEQIDLIDGGNYLCLSNT